MNNHKSTKIVENEIDYHLLKFSTINKDDVKIIEKFIKKHKYVKIIHYTNSDIEISYYKNNSLHNDLGPSILYEGYEGIENINIKKYYLNGIEISYNKWKNNFRKYKLLKLKKL
jgi:hypothetical protein